MEFDELQKIWDTQNNQPLFVINEKALHNRILAKKHQAIHIAVVTEWLLIIVNTLGGIFLLVRNLAGRSYITLFVLGGWMIVCAVYVVINRLYRRRGQHRFDRSLAGDLQHALATAAYQVRIARIMRWNTWPIAGLVLLSVWESGKPVWLALAIGLFFLLVYYAGGWELGIYHRKKRELEILQQKLMEA